MKKIIFNSVYLYIIFATSLLYAQSPSISYQAVVRDAKGNLYVNSLVDIQVKIMKNQVSQNSGPSEYFQKTYKSLPTNQIGMVSLIIGASEQESDLLKKMNWDDINPYYLDLKINATNSGELLESESLPMLAVPYSFLSTSLLLQDSKHNYYKVLIEDKDPSDIKLIAVKNDVGGKNQFTYPSNTNYEIPELLYVIYNGKKIYVNSILFPPLVWGTENFLNAISEIDGHVNALLLPKSTKEGAMRLCSNRNDYGYTDWYLPSIGELNSVLKDQTRLGLSIKNTLWSSSEIDKSTAWSLSFSSENGKLLKQAKKTANYFICVRKG